MRWFSKALGAVLALAISSASAQNLGPPGGGGSSAGPPTGAAGGDLGGTYPNPTVQQIQGAAYGTGVVAALQSPAGGTGGFALQSALASYCLLTGCTYSGAILAPAGSAPTPGIAVGIAGTGLYQTTGNLLFTIGGVNAATLTSGGNFMTSGTISGNSLNAGNGNVTMAQSFSTFNFRNGGAVISSPASNTIQFGSADTAAPSVQSIFFQNVVAGTSNIAGANATIRGSLSTGSGTSGDIIFQTGGTGAAATSQNSAVAALTIKGATQHMAYGGSAPAVSACGTGTPGVDANATDSSGRITTGTVAASCTITFAKAYTTFNHCRITSQSAISGLAYSYTLSAITLTATALAGGLIDYDCDGV